MKNTLLLSLCVTIASMFLTNCSARQIQSAPITDIRVRPEAPIIEEHSVIAPANEISMEDLRALYNNAGKPTIGIIKGFYQLPESSPYGAITIERGRSFGFDYESVKVSKIDSSPFVIKPASAPEVEAISSTMNQLMDAGIRFREVSFADAMKIIEAEKAAVAKKKFVFPSTRVPSGVDLLLSVERGSGSFGPIYVGRVIGTKEGQLYALSTQPDVGAYSLNPLITQLVKDSLRRMGASQ